MSDAASDLFDFLKGLKKKDPLEDFNKKAKELLDKLEQISQVKKSN